jgi:hypothetical protein
MSGTTDIDTVMLETWGSRWHNSNNLQHMKSLPLLLKETLKEHQILCIVFPKSLDEYQERWQAASTNLIKLVLQDYSKIQLFPIAGYTVFAVLPNT